MTKETNRDLARFILYSGIVLIFFTVATVGFVAKLKTRENEKKYADSPQFMRYCVNIVNKFHRPCFDSVDLLPFLVGRECKEYRRGYNLLPGTWKNIYILPDYCRKPCTRGYRPIYEDGRIIRLVEDCFEDEP